MRNHLRIGKGLFVHLFAPATPVGVHIDQDHFWILFIGSDGLLKLHPLDLGLGLEVQTEKNQEQNE